jgi:hypothetical protein
MRATPDILDKQFGLTKDNANADIINDVFAAGYTRVTLDHSMWFNGKLRIPARAWFDADAPDCWLIRATPEACVELESDTWMSDVHVYGNQMPGPNIVAAPGSAHQHLRDCNSTDCLGPALDCSGMVVNSNGAGAGMIIEGGQYIRSIAKDENGVQYSERPAIEFDAYNRGNAYGAGRNVLWVSEVMGRRSWRREFS